MISATCPHCGKTFRLPAEMESRKGRCSDCQNTFTIEEDAVELEAVDEPDENVVRCPHCGSTQVHVGRRGWTFWSGLIGSSTIMLTCLKCGHSTKAVRR